VTADGCFGLRRREDHPESLRRFAILIQEAAF
jgi:hypothetical protein